MAFISPSRIKCEVAAISGLRGRRACWPAREERHQAQGRPAGQREAAHTGALSPEGRGPGLHNQLLRAWTDPAGTVPVPLGTKASEIGAENTD